METNIKIAADVQTVRTHIMIKKDEYNAITSVWVPWKFEPSGKQNSAKQIHFTIAVYDCFRDKKEKRSVHMRMSMYVERHSYIHKCSLYRIPVINLELSDSIRATPAL